MFRGVLRRRQAPGRGQRRPGHDCYLGPHHRAKAPRDSGARPNNAADRPTLLARREAALRHGLARPLRLGRGHRSERERLHAPAGGVADPGIFAGRPAGRSRARRHRNDSMGPGNGRRTGSLPRVAGPLRGGRARGRTGARGRVRRQIGEHVGRGRSEAALVRRGHSREELPRPTAGVLGRREAVRRRSAAARDLGVRVGQRKGRSSV